MKKFVFISSAALLIVGLFALGRQIKEKRKILTSVENDITHKNSVLKLLHHAKRAAIKELHKN